MQTMSITRALVEIKSLDRKIEAMADVAGFIAVATGEGSYKKVQGSTPEKAESQIRANIQSLNQLVRNRQKIKALVVESNANTKVTLNNTQVSVAAAIELKSTVNAKKKILAAMKRQYSQALATVSQINEKVDAGIEAALQVVYGNDKGKVDESMYQSVAKPQKEQKYASLVDPCDLQSKIKELEAEIEVLESEVDFVLSESNAKTTIEVDLTS